MDALIRGVRWPVVKMDVEVVGGRPVPDLVTDPAGFDVGGGTVDVVMPGGAPWDDDPAVAVGDRIRVLEGTGNRFAGWVAGATGATQQDVVSLQVVDASHPLSTAVVRTPVVLGTDGGPVGQFGMHTQWVAEDALWREGLSALPPLGPTPTWRQSMAGSLAPNVADDRRNASVGQAPTWVTARWGIGLLIGSTLDSGTRLGSLRQGAGLRCQATVDPFVAIDDGLPSSAVVNLPVTDAAGTRRTVTLTVTLNTGALSWGTDPLSTEVGVAAVDLWFDGPADDPTLRFRRWWQGQEITSGVVDRPASGWHPDGIVMSPTVTTNGLPVGGVEVGPLPGAPPPAYIAGTLASIGHPITMAVPTDESVGAMVGRVAATSGGMIWWDNAGRVQAVGPDELSVAEPALTLDNDGYGSVPWEASDVQHPSEVRVPWVPAVATNLPVIRDAVVYVGGRTGRKVELGWGGRYARIKERGTGRVSADPESAAGGSLVRWRVLEQRGDRATFLLRNPTSGRPWFHFQVLPDPDDPLTVVFDPERSDVWVHTTDGTGDPVEADVWPLIQTAEAAADVAQLTAQWYGTPVHILPLAMTHTHVDVGQVVRIVDPLYSDAEVRRGLVVATATDHAGTQTVTVRDLPTSWDRWAIYVTGTWTDWAGRAPATWDDLTDDVEAVAWA